MSGTNAATGRTQERGRGDRTLAEWVTFAIAAVVLLVVVGLLVAQLGADDPAAPIVFEIGAPRERADTFFVEADIVNRGDLTAANVQVTAELTIDAETTSADQVIDFLAGGETDTLEFAFADDPADGELTIEVGSFAPP